MRRAKGSIVKRSEKKKKNKSRKAQLKTTTRTRSLTESREN